MPRLSNIQRERAIGMLNTGTSVTDVARVMGCSRQTIHNFQTCLHQTGTTADRPRPGRPRVTSRAQDRQIVLRHLRNRFVTATSTGNELFGGRVTAQTIRNRLRSARLHARRFHRRQHFLWARRHLRWTQRDWNRVVFRDESRFTLTFADGRVRVWRRRGERNAQCCIQEVDRFGGGRVMVWGGINGHARSRLIVIQGNLNAAAYRDQVLVPELLPFMAAHGPGLTFQQDNARPHTANLTTNFLRDAGINVMEWPSRSPDLNPIEHVWDVLGRQLHQVRNPPQNLQELGAMLVQIWRRIPQAVFRCKNIVLSMQTNGTLAPTEAYFTTYSSIYRYYFNPLSCN
uniref:Tc1-like transposase DDE domain-containing protein n=1 Tax=Eptatretus burgeri TaxID=7764 RepID=A0A8C4QU92_EPTBU